MGMNFTKQERETILKHVNELAGEELPFNDALHWLQNECGLAFERYAQLLSVYPTLPAQFIVDCEKARHNLALDNEDRDRKIAILRKNQDILADILAAHRHAGLFGKGEAVIVSWTPYGNAETPVSYNLQQF